MAIKSKYNFSVSYYNGLVDLVLDILPKPHKSSKDFYYTKFICVRIIACYFGRKIKISSTVRYTFCKKCRYKKMVNKDGSMQITSVPVKMLQYNEKTE
jgi:hypothetical protein